jgi:serine/threonine protein kinase
MAELISAGPFATEGEQQAAAELKKLPGEWVVICNKTLPTSDGRSYEIDFIVIGDRWVFLIDEKSWRRKITGTDQSWTHGNRSMNSPLNKADYVSKILADYIRSKVPGLRSYFVRGGILLSLAKTQPQIQDPRARDGVFLLTDICQRLPTIDGQGGIPAIGQLRDQIKESLVDLSGRPEVPSEIGAYTIEEVIVSRPGCKILQATIDGGETRTLILYDTGRDPTEAADLKRFYMRAFTALRSLRDTGLVPEVHDPFPWSDDFLVLPISVISDKYLNTHPYPKTQDDFIDELILAETTFKGLGEIHRKEILHRAIGSDSIIVVSTGLNCKIAFTNFFAARTSELSIAASLDALTIEDPYAAPELAGGYGFATKKTDIFSLTLVFLERLSGVSVADLKPPPDHKVIIPDFKSIWSEIPKEVIDELLEIFRGIFIPETESLALSAGEIADLFGDLARRLRVDVSIESEGLLDNRYKVHRPLGQGNMARTYLVTDIEFDELFAVKQFYRPSNVLEQAKAEFSVLRQTHSPYLPRVYDVYPAQQDIHIKMDYVPGPTLEQVEAEFPWPLERWWTFAQDLMSAVEELEKHNLLHRDIKPSNIILHEDDNRPVLIDFGFAVQQGIKTHAAGAPLYLPPEALSSSQPPPSSDRYALSVVLFKVLTGINPFELSGERMLITLEQISNEKARKIAEVLFRAVSNDPAERHSSVEELRVALQAALIAVDEPPETEDLEELVNPWVDSVRGLYRNSDIGNADNRGLDTDFAQQTYISTALDDRLMPALFEKLPKVIFLSGNPGDGKTAFLEQVKVELERRQATAIEQNESGWEYTYNTHTFRSCYDASEAHEGQSADEQLTVKLHGLEGDDSPDIPLTVLIAINDGRLADYFTRNQDRFVWLSDQIEMARDPATGILFDVWLVDLKQRSFVNFPGSATPSVFQRVLKRLAKPEEWKICDGCAAKVVCPIRSNAAALREPIVSERLEYLLR